MLGKKEKKGKLIELEENATENVRKVDIFIKRLENAKTEAVDTMDGVREVESRIEDIKQSCTRVIDFVDGILGDE